MIHRSNGFDGLRIIAAAMVIYGHAFPLTGHIAPGLLANGIQTIGVKIFFVISGYLITRSWQSDPSLVRFWSKRALRIMPGLIAICLLTILIAGPLLTELSIKEYFANGLALNYLWNVALYPVYGLPGLFRNNIYPNAVNGSLWSLPVEVAMYCGVPILVGHYRKSARVIIPAVALALLVASIYFVRVSPPQTPLVIWGTSLTSALDVAYYFYAGGTFAVLRLDQNCRPFSAGLFFIVAAWLVQGEISGEVALAITLPYLVISFGKLKLSLLRPLDGHDYSYGLYLYGFLVQQIVIHFIGPQPAAMNAAISLPITAVLAALSWRLIERPALRLKPERQQVDRGKPFQSSAPAA